jgi:hypothetical protein
VFKTGMNVIMPVAMKTMHEDPELAANSAKTAERGIQVLKALSYIPDVSTNARAILAAATNETTKDDASDPKLIKVRSTTKMSKMIE